ncbi:hypothetical protein L9F63_001510, partial [Diploptera punctata]
METNTNLPLLKALKPSFYLSKILGLYPVTTKSMKFRKTKFGYFYSFLIYTIFLLSFLYKLCFHSKFQPLMTPVDRFAVFLHDWNPIFIVTVVMFCSIFSIHIYVPHGVILITALVQTFFGIIMIPGMGIFITMFMVPSKNSDENRRKWCNYIANTVSKLMLYQILNQLMSSSLILRNKFRAINNDLSSYYDSLTELYNHTHSINVKSGHFWKNHFRYKSFNFASSNTTGTEMNRSSIKNGERIWPDYLYSENALNISIVDRPTDNFQRRLEILLYIHEYLCNISNDINVIFSFPLLMTLAAIFCDILTSLYTILTNWIERQQVDLFLVEISYWTGIQFFYILAVAGICSLTTEEVTL